MTSFEKDKAAKLKRLPLLWIRNILMLPLIIVLRMIPGLLWFALRPIMSLLESWHDAMSAMGIYWKREGDE